MILLNITNKLYAGGLVRVRAQTRANTGPYFCWGAAGISSVRIIIIIIIIIMTMIIIIIIVVVVILL